MISDSRGARWRQFAQILRDISLDDRAWLNGNYIMHPSELMNNLQVTGKCIMQMIVPSRNVSRALQKASFTSKWRKFTNKERRKYHQKVIYIKKFITNNLLGANFPTRSFVSSCYSSLESRLSWGNIYLNWWWTRWMRLVLCQHRRIVLIDNNDFVITILNGSRACGGEANHTIELIKINSFACRSLYMKNLRNEGIQGELFVSFINVWLNGELVLQRELLKASAGLNNPST